MLSKISLEELGSENSAIDLIVCAASFEERCLSIARRIASRAKQAVIVRNSEFISSTEANYKSLRVLFEGRARDANVSMDSPTATADILLKEVIFPILSVGGGDVFVDITTFSHEQLLILIALIKRYKCEGGIKFGYTGAGEYSTNTDEENVWLSHGLRQVRSILGYPGSLAPSRRLHLIVLMGFESERARLLIEMMEPSRLSLGVGDPQRSVSPHHYSRNERFASRLNSFLETQTQIQAEIERFSFSCVSPFDARDAVLREAYRYSEFNTVVCPMNTKISTVGAGMAALEDQRLQVVYACPEEYNETGYSTPGEDVTIFSITASPDRRAGASGP